MNYIEYTFETQNSSLNSEFLIALLYNEGFEGFAENETGLTGYLPEELDNPQGIEKIVQDAHPHLGKLSVSRKLLEERNWNEEWEKGFQPISIGKEVYIRAPFHKSIPSISYDLVIEPKMSFGTGHHETTRLMIEAMLPVSMEGFKVLDIGCGTGILSVFASKLKADSILAVDIDTWAVDNCLENAERNACMNISVVKGCMKSVTQKEFHLILANINTNVLIQDMENYHQSLDKNGMLILSGIMSHDVEKITARAISASFDLLKASSSGDWHCMTFRKS